MFAGRVARSASRARRARDRKPGGEDTQLGCADEVGLVQGTAGPACLRAHGVGGQDNGDRRPVHATPRGLAWTVSVTRAPANCWPVRLPPGSTDGWQLVTGSPPGSAHSAAGMGGMSRSAVQCGNSLGTKRCRSKATGVTIRRTGDGWLRLQGRMSVDLRQFPKPCVAGSNPAGGTDVDHQFSVEEHPGWGLLFGGAGDGGDASAARAALGDGLACWAWRTA